MKCPNCSGELSFDINAQAVQCPYCGSVFNPATMEVNVKYAGESKEPVTVPQQVVEQNNIVSKEENVDINNSYEGKSYTCSQCGATLLTFDETAITFCSYCGSQAILESKMVRVNNPDYVIPFLKTKDECIANYKKKIRKSLFAPSYMKSNITIQKFRGIFMPYVVYHLDYHGDYTAKGTKRKYRRGDYVYYDDYDIVTKIDTDYQGISYDLISKYYDKYSEIIPFDFNDVKDFNISYLSGFYADSKDVESTTYDQIVKNIIKNECAPKLFKLKEYKKYSVEKAETPLIVKERKIGIFPVYFLSVRDKKNEHISYAVVNGQTGKVATDVPVDFKKYVILTILISILIFLLIDNYVLILPKTVLGIGLFSSLISLIISNVQLNRLNYRRQHLDDMGVISQKKDEYKKEIKLINEKSKGHTIEKVLDRGFLKFILIAPFFFLGCRLLFSFIMSKNGEKSFVENFTDDIYPFMIFIAIGMVFFLLFGGFIFLVNLLFGNAKSSISKNKITDKGKMTFKEKLSKYLYKQIIAMVVCVLVFLINPVDDMYYYLGALLCFTLTVYSFYDLVKEHNEIISNKLPQLEKRGGDEND